MRLYTYEAVNKSGHLITGQLEAEQEWMVVERLRQMGFWVVEVKAVRPSAVRGAVFRSRKVGLGDLTLFSRQLTSMLDAGIPLTRALFTLSKQIANPTLRNAVSDVARNVEGGQSFSDALSAHPGIFSTLFVSMTRAGEVGGFLSEALSRLSTQLEQEKSIRDHVRSASFYPIAVLGFAGVVVLAMLYFLVPVFMQFFPEGMVLPLPTRVVVVLSNSLHQWWFIWAITVAALVLGFRYYLRSPAGSRAWDRLKYRLPVFGSLFHRAVMARFARTLATLLTGGIPILQALEASGPASGSQKVAEAVHGIIEQIQEGKNLAGPMGDSGIFPPMMVDMVAVGEESGTLPDLLGRIAAFYEEEVATMAKGLTALLEPLMLVVIGIIIAVVVISLYLPIFTAVISGVR
ncbi:type II secretion system F family protein [Candidatus Desulforudis audaxviator]|uniref:Type II secretion system protein n=1 Tax=Desulforudis audaxviator (strain MP104C) TaxID=477974 RepID=B1I3G1_DESAP|nr:type II secretion system F family protein [Candidatus Desulforudis audaxviator]ACA59465.1 type II secretion system protein [Candidatus Desulforudis audaxviator MP104C]AZK59447.1 Type IV fimbrial assembly protein PilC [Candidatus Desulforudis audaxviator]